MRVVFFFVLVLYAWPGIGEIVFYGKVSAEGKGIAGVAVTDGFHTVLTGKDGKYRLSGDEEAEFVYLSLPSGYTAPLEGNVPCFYQRVTDKTCKRQRFDFFLQKDRYSQNEHVLVVCADPQVYFEEELLELKGAAADMEEWIDERYAGKRVYGLVCGDVVGDMRTKPAYFEPVKEILGGTGFPFFYVPGNHDADLNVRTQERSKATYMHYLGPTWYSFNLGRVHYVVLDDVFTTGKDYAYIGYIDERQLKWLEQDLAFVPENGVVVLALHIPTYSVQARNGKFSEERATQTVSNRKHLYELLKPYRVHLLSGHEHYQENYVVSERIFEHVQAALCGLFWQAPWCSDGTPAGYTVYEAAGERISWYFKAVGEDKSYQFRVYVVGENPEKPDALTVNIWNYDPAWKVYWYEDGCKMGEMHPYTGIDPGIERFVAAHRKSFRYDYIGAAPTGHLFYAVPSSGAAGLKVEVVDRFGHSYVWETPSSHK